MHLESMTASSWHATAAELRARLRARLLASLMASLIASLIAGCGSGGGSGAMGAGAGAPGASSGGGGGGGGPVSIAPVRGALTIGQAQVFGATVSGSGDTTVVWDVDGIVGGSAAVGTVDATGLYTAPTAPASAGQHTVTATSRAAPTQKASARIAVTDLPGVFTYHNDAQRSGQNLQEYALDAATVANPAAFGRLFACPVDAAVYAQPLYAAHLAIAGGVHNVVIVATENDSVYAFDADAPACTVYWYVSFVAPTVPNLGAVDAADTNATDDLPGKVGITGTPVIANGQLYVVAKTKNSATGAYALRLHALALASGAEATAAVEVSAAASASGGRTFTPLIQAQRPALLFANGIVYVPLGSHGDNGDYSGWLIGYDAATLQQTAVFNTAPVGSGQAGIWMSGSGPALDAAGGIYFSTGNGIFDSASNAYGESLLRVALGTLAAQDYFTPTAYSAMNATDSDFGSGGVVVLPDSMGSAAHPHLVVAVDKSGNFYLVDRDNMGRYSAAGDTDVQTLSVGFATESGGCAGSVSCGFFSTPAVWRNAIYGAAQADFLKAYPVANATIVAMPSAQSAEIYPFPGATPSISAAGAAAQGAIVWVLDTHANGTANGNASGPAILRAYDASGLGKPLYTSDASTTETCGNAVKFTVPTVANGRVYIAGDGQLTVYGLKP